MKDRVEAAERLTWDTSPLGSVCTVIAGQSPKSSAYNEDARGLPFYQGKKEFTDRFLAPPTTWTTQVTKRAKPKDILMSVRAPVGPINETKEAICIGRGLAAIRAGKKIDRGFLWYALLWLQPEIVGNAGAVFPSINKKAIEGLELPRPPLEEQKRIVAVLDQAFAALDRARAHAEANLADAEALFESWLSAAFEFGAEHWPVKTLPEISVNLDRLRVPITKKDRQLGDVPYYGASGAVDHVADYIFDEDLLLVSEDGANLLARTYPIAFSISGRSWVNNHAHVLRFEDLASQEFVRLYLNSISLDPWVSGMAQPKLNQKALSTIPISYPDARDRTRIVVEAAEIWRGTEAARTNYDAQLGDISALRQSLLQHAFAGQLT